MNKIIYMLILLIYDIVLLAIRRNGINRILKDDITDFIIKIIPVVMCIIGALG